MRTETPVLALTLALLVLTAALGPAVLPAGGTIQPDLVTWSPFGPRARNLVMTVYGDFQTMFDAFLEGKIDITDWPIEPADVLPFLNNPDFFVTDKQAEFLIYQLDINHHNSFLGVPMQEPRTGDSFDSPSTKGASLAGIHIRRALAHMLDKPSFVQGAQLQGQADFVDTQAAPAQDLTINGASPSKLPQPIIDEDCQDHTWFSPGNCHPVSAYNLVTDNLPDPFNSFANRGWSGTADLRAACDHLVIAGFTITPSIANCTDVASGSGGAHLVPMGQVDFYIRSHSPRKAFGQIIKDAIDFLYGTPCTARYGVVCSESYFGIVEISDIVFRTEPDRDDWHLYTGGWSLGSFPEQFFSRYHSNLASSVCGGKKSTFATNYHFYCSPEFDQEAAAGQFALSFPDASLHFASAAVIAHRDVMTVPVYSPSGQRFAALNGWNFQPGIESSLVPELGRGFQRGFWSVLNMRQKPGYVPFDSRYAPGGGDADLIRRSLTREVLRLSPFTASTVWEFEVLETVYDSMLQVNPLTGGAGQQAVDWMTLRHSSVFDPVAGVTTQTWTLRNDLKWHDGVPVTADDVAYTIAAYRDVPSGSFQPSVFGVLDATAVDSGSVRVVLTGQSPFFELNIGKLPVIPKHVWAPFCGDPPSPASVCADPAFDPMATGILVGSGPWVCRNIDTGAVGGSCHRPACPSGVVCPAGGQIVGRGGEIVFEANADYHRGRPGVADSSLHKFSWADSNNDARVDILDIADVAVRFGGPDAYWNTGQNSMAPQTVGSDAAKVDIAEVATVAFYFGYGLVTPLTPSAVVGLDPDIDPFF